MADENQPEMTDDEKAAAEWEASLANEGGDGAAAAGGDAEEQARILNQDEIDSLLGFDTVSGGGQAKDGIFAILDKSMTAYEKLPMIEVVFDRLVRQLSTSFRNFTSENVEVSLDSMTSVRFEDYLNSIPLPALLVIFRAVEWENYGMVMVDSAQIYTIVDILLGGRKSSKKNVRVEGRPYTIIEQDLVKRMVDILLADLGAAFEPISPATFTFDRLETNPRFATISRPANPALLVKFRVDMLEDRGGFIELLLPHATLEPIRDLLLQMFMGENFGQDTVWEKHLGKELRNAAVTVETVLPEKTITLKDVMSFKVGSTLLLDCNPEDEVMLRCGGVPITTGVLGKVGDNIAVSLTEDIKRKPK